MVQGIRVEETARGIRVRSMADPLATDGTSAGFWKSLPHRLVSGQNIPLDVRVTTHNGSLVRLLIP